MRQVIKMSSLKKLQSLCSQQSQLLEGAEAEARARERGKGRAKGVLQGQREKKWQTHSPNQVLDKELCNPTLKRPSGLSWGPRADKR